MSDTIIQQSEFFHTHVYTVYYVDDDFSSFTFKNMFESRQNGLGFILKEKTLFLKYEKSLSKSINKRFQVINLKKKRGNFSWKNSVY